MLYYYQPATYDIAPGVKILDQKIKVNGVKIRIKAYKAKDFPKVKEKFTAKKKSAAVVGFIPNTVPSQKETTSSISLSKGMRVPITHNRKTKAFVYLYVGNSKFVGVEKPTTKQILRNIFAR